ncbi:MAG: 3-deoxy-7-phosphoheptulonate synthase [Verrucomicrobiales bacterium]|jgi:3-deoxy-7-phosphoheptulonate synthase
MSLSIIDDVRIAELKPLIAPQVLMGELSPSAEDVEFVASARRQAEAIMSGKDDRLLVVVGPCSIHDSKAALEYAGQLKTIADELAADLQIVMRVYFEKPRTTVGWKGFINDPDLDGQFDINKGLRQARDLLLELTKMGVAAGTEFLDTISPQYIADLVTWGAIGARTTESQIHRELASGLSMPVGFKNGTAGSIGIAIDAINAARHPHHFLSVTKQGVSAIVATKGNETCHVILRGSKSGPNHDAVSVSQVVEQLKAAKLAPQVMIDCSHGNSLKDHRNQPKVAEEVGAQLNAGSKSVAGVMIESNLVEGNQKIQETLEQLTYGQSITDACVDFDTTVAMLRGLSDSVQARRKS